METEKNRKLGRVLSVSGIQVTARLDPTAVADGRMTVGKLIAVRALASWVVGVVSWLSVSTTDEGDQFEARIDLLGEIRKPGEPDCYFQKGVTDYPTIGDIVTKLSTDDLRLIHLIDKGETIQVGHLQLDSAIPAYVNFDELLPKHFAVLGTTGVGKSTSVALILREILARKSNLRIFLIDPHNEYGACFGQQARIVNPKNLRLPFWLFNFEEIVDVFFRSRPGVEEESEILAELIPVAKAKYAANARSERMLLRKSNDSGYIADTPVPYRVSDLVSLINDRMGKLENRSSWMKYHRLVSRIESLGHDSRYSFMFNNLFIEDLMVDVVRELFRLPPEGKPVTVLQMAGFPSEVVDSVVSVVSRMAFEFGVWSDGAAPILLACEEAHRYAPADRNLGFGPTRKSISRIAKEGRKYGVYLAAVTQRPAELDPTILSQCSTIFAMRMANDRDQAIVRSAIPDAGASLLEFLPSLGTREAIAFGEGVALPTRFHFSEVPRDKLPRSQSGPRQNLDVSRDISPDFIANVIDRWRDSTTTSTRPKMAVMGFDKDAADRESGWGSTVPDAPEPSAFR